MDKHIIEEIILGMADIVVENRVLRNELKEAKEWERKYHELQDRRAQQANEGMRLLFESMCDGAFATPEERKCRKEDL